MKLKVQTLPVEASAEEVLSGAMDAHLLPPRDKPLIDSYSDSKRGVWWRITSPKNISADSVTKLVLQTPYLRYVQAWVPGRAAPSHHSVYGKYADDRHSPQVFVIDLPNGLTTDSSVWLLVHDDNLALPMSVRLDSLDQIMRADISWTVWRTASLSIIMTLALLGLAFWVATQEKSYIWFSLMLCFATFYAVSIGGDFRAIPGAEWLFGYTLKTQWLYAILGIFCTNLFQRAYLDLANKLPRLNRFLDISTGLGILALVFIPFPSLRLSPLLGNLALMSSSTVLLIGSLILAWRGDRSGRVVVISWLPLMVCALLVAGMMMRLWSGPTSLNQALLGSFVAAGLLLTIGLADKFMQLRRDRDTAKIRASSDTLTGALNRFGTEQYLVDATAFASSTNTPLSIAFFDIDRFKSINDKFGHAVGDQCLRLVAQHTNKYLGENEQLGRLGGDEFVIIWPETKLSTAARIAEQIRQTIEKNPLEINSQIVQCTLSIGVAEMQPEESVESLLHRADKALYACKSAGRNCITVADISN